MARAGHGAKPDRRSSRMRAVGAATWLAFAVVSGTVAIGCLEPDTVRRVTAALDPSALLAGLTPGESLREADLAHVADRLASDNQAIRERVAALEDMLAGPTGAVVKPGGGTQEDTGLVSRTRFGVDLGRIDTLDRIAGHWRELGARHGEALSRLTPVAALDERPDGGLELRLVAGPFDDAGDAATLCARIAVSGTPCRSTTFEGRRIVMR